ncbi:MAG: ABC transporter ATP-binding protein [Proteobacteria bacterium]|nr:ABC transporter ATP-binding protein [Pseudomonadota bacterium]
MSPVEESPLTSPVLHTEGIQFAYGRRSVLRGVELKVERGQVYGFLGRNGAGKTTTLQILLGILIPNSGIIHFAGRSVGRTTPGMKQRIGYVSQHQHFYEWMSCHRLGRFVAGFYPSWDQASFNKRLHDLKIEPKQKVGTLSGGSKMKLAMALALATQPEILILDEPTAGVDPIARREILDMMRTAAQDENRTVLFSTHNIYEVGQIADVVGVLHEGELVYQGAVGEFVAHVRNATGEALEDGDLEAAFVALVVDG